MEAYAKRVIARLKDQGLDIAEDLLVHVADAILDEAVVEVQGNNVAWDDFLVGPIQGAKGMIHKMIDKIDGKVDLPG